MKKTAVSVPMWDVLAMPSQLELLQKELQTVEVQRTTKEINPAVSLMQPSPSEASVKKARSSPFYLSVIIGDKIVHNCMIDSGASSTIMPRCVANQLGLKYEPLIKHVLQLDGTSVTIVGVIKGLKMALHACLGCTVT